jgi:uncharacterized protein (DUF736 family)
MSFTPKPNSGYLWPNDKKTEDKHPDFRGDSVIDKRLLMDLISKGDDPVKISVSAWNSTAKDGRAYYYLSFSEPFVPTKKAEPPKAEPQAEPEDDEDVPF